MMEVAKTVPLAGALRVEFDFVVVPVSGQWRVDKGRHLVDQTLAAEAWRLDGANRPIQGHGDSIFEFFIRLLDDLGSEQVQCTEDVFLAALVKNAPSTTLMVSACTNALLSRSMLTLWHVLDLRQAVEVWNLVCHCDDNTRAVTYS